MVWVKGFKYAWPKYSLRSDHLSHGLHSQMGIIFAQQRVVTKSRRPRLRSSRPSFADLCYLYGTGIQSDRLYPLFLNHTYPVTIPQAPRKMSQICTLVTHCIAEWASMQHGEGPFLIFDCAFSVRVCMRQRSVSRSPSFFTKDDMFRNECTRPWGVSEMIKWYAPLTPADSLDRLYLPTSLDA